METATYLPIISFQRQVWRFFMFLHLISTCVSGSSHSCLHGVRQVGRTKSSLVKCVPPSDSVGTMSITRQVDGRVRPK